MSEGLTREQAIRAVISAEGHLRAEFGLPTDPMSDIAKAERAVDAYLAQRETIPAAE